LNLLNELDAQGANQDLLMPQVVGAIGVDQRVLETDLTLFVKAEQGLVEGLAAFLDALLHAVFDRIDLAAFYQVFDVRGIHHYFQGGGAPAVDGANQPLGNDRSQVQRQLKIDLGVAFMGEKVHDALDGLVGVVRVQRAQAEVAGFRKGDRRFHGFGVADFTDQNHVRRLAQGIF
jgi:hypothetical protein